GTGARVSQSAGDGCHGSGISARLRGFEFFLSGLPNVGRLDTLPVEGPPTIRSQEISAKKPRQERTIHLAVKRPTSRYACRPGYLKSCDEAAPALRLIASIVRACT